MIAGVPIAMIVGWWAVSLTVWVVGYPIPYDRTNLPLVVLLVIACVLAALVGFLFVARRLPGGISTPGSAARFPVPALIGVIALAVLLVPWAEFYSGFHAWDLGSAVLDQGGAYQAAAERVAEGPASRGGMLAVQIILAPFTLAALPVTALVWFERRRHLALFALVLFVNAAMSFLVGRDFYFVSALFVVLAAWVLSRVRRRMAPTWPEAVVVASGAAVFFIAFTARKLSRGAAASTQPLCLPGASECVQPAPSIWESLVIYVASYSSQSMEGLGRGLSGDWAFGGGYRHSPVLTSIAEAAGLPETRVITDQLEGNGWSDTAYWSTGWTWMANDIPWLLVPLVVACMAAFLGVTWRGAVRDGDWLAVTLFCNGWFTLFFMAQNNMLTVDGRSYLGFLSLALVFAVREVRRKAAPGSPEELTSRLQADAAAPP